MPMRSKSKTDAASSEMPQLEGMTPATKEAERTSVVDAAAAAAAAAEAEDVATAAAAAQPSTSVKLALQPPPAMFKPVKYPTLHIFVSGSILC